MTATIARQTATPAVTATPTISDPWSLFAFFFFFLGRGASMSSSTSVRRERAPTDFAAAGRDGAERPDVRTAAELGAGLAAAAAASGFARVGSLHFGQRIRLPATASGTCRSALH